MGYAFISYSSTNQTAADSLRTLFTQNGIDTWMAPYNIPAGSEYAEVLYDALVGCACLVLILTDNSQNSTWVKKEVNIAISNGKTVIPLKLEDIELNSSMRLYLNDQQIVPISVIDGNSEAMRKVVGSVITYTGQSATVAQTHSTIPSAQIHTAAPASPEPDIDPWECYWSGYRYETGDGAAVDLAKAAYWYEKGAKLGNPWCQHRMGEFNLFGWAMPKNYEAAFQWYKLSAEQEDPSASDRLSQCYQHGWGVKPDPHLARVWKNRAERYR